MKIKELPQDVEDEDKDIDLDESLEDRHKDWSGYKYVRKQLEEVYAAVEKAFEDKQAQNEIIEACWNCYNCELDSNQGYNGTSQVYVPIVHDAMGARQTRFINMLFPQNGRYADIVSNDGKIPYDMIALMDYYISTTAMRRAIVPAMIRAGDCSGNYILYVEWGVKSRYITNKEKVPEMQTELGTPVEGSPEYDDISYEEVKDERPIFSVLDARNLVVLPTAVDDIDDAEVVAVAFRYTKEKIREFIREGIFLEDEAKDLLANMSSQDSYKNVNTSKKAAKSIGIESDSKGNKTALIYQIWTKLKIRGEYRMMVSYFAGADRCLGCKRNPYWNDRVPVIAQPVEKEGDVFWGKAPVDPVRTLQYSANDAVNMGFDSAQYALLPIVMTDPEKNPNVGSLILSMAAIWLVDPNSTKFANFPQLWKEAFTIVAASEQKIFQSLGVNPAMLPHANAGKKPTQAEIAQAQQVALESSNDEVAILEAVLQRVLEWCYDLDYQYRTKAITVKKFGQMGLQATMDQVPVQSVRQQYNFRWFGYESFKATQQIQQMISWGNVLMNIPPQALNGRRVDISPMLEAVTEAICGPRIAPHVLIDQRHDLSLSPEMENEMLDHGLPVQTHPMDNDPEHLQAHMQSYKMMPNDMKKGHILEHIKQMKEKAAAQAAAQQQRQLPPGRKAPKPGAGAQAPTGAQNPPGAVHPDNMPLAMPRKGGI